MMIYFKFGLYIHAYTQTNIYTVYGSFDPYTVYI